MRTTMIWIAYLIAGLGSLSIAAFMAYNDKGGWGWFLLIGFLMFGAISISSGKKHTDEDLRKAFDAARESPITWAQYLESIQPKEDEDEE